VCLESFCDLLTHRACLFDQHFRKLAFLTNHLAIGGQAMSNRGPQPVQWSLTQGLMNARDLARDDDFLR